MDLYGEEMKINSEAVVVAAAVAAAVVAIHSCCCCIRRDIEDLWKQVSSCKPIEWVWAKRTILSRNLSIFTLFRFVSFATILTRSRFTIHGWDLIEAYLILAQAQAQAHIYTLMIWFSIRNRYQLENILSLIPKTNTFHWAKCANEQKQSTQHRVDELYTTSRIS